MTAIAYHPIYGAIPPIYAPSLDAQVIACAQRIAIDLLSRGNICDSAGRRGTDTAQLYRLVRATMGRRYLDTASSDLDDESVSEGIIRALNGHELPPAAPAGQEVAEVSDVLYAISARISREPDEIWTSTVDVPTFYLDSRVQGIVSEDHAWGIARKMFADLGYADDAVSIQVCATARA